MKVEFYRLFHFSAYPNWENSLLKGELKHDQEGILWHLLFCLQRPSEAAVKLKEANSSLDKLKGI
jgi:hypothetical protein